MEKSRTSQAARKALLRNTLARLGESRGAAVIVATFEARELRLDVWDGFVFKGSGYRPLRDYLGFGNENDADTARRALGKLGEWAVGKAVIRQAADTLEQIVSGLVLSSRGRVSIGTPHSPPQPWADLGYALTLSPNLLEVFFGGDEAW